MATPQQLKPELIERLIEIAERQGQDVNDVVVSMIEIYRMQNERKREDIRQIIDENRDLLDRLG